MSIKSLVKVCLDIANPNRGETIKVGTSGQFRRVKCGSAAVLFMASEAAVCDLRILLVSR